MHIWPNPSIVKTHKLYNVTKFNNSRPKKLKDSDWNDTMKEFKYNKKVVLECLPKLSQKRVSQELTKEL